MTRAATGAAAGALRTVSLRRRVTWTALAVMGVVLVGVVLVVHALFGVVVTRGVNAVLADRAQLAQQLARQNVRPIVLIERVDARSVRARLTLTDGQVYGSLTPSRLADSRVTRRQVRLRSAGPLNGAVLTLAADSALLSGAQSRLLWVLVITGVGALLVTATVLLVGVRRALAPLDAMAALAGQIARGGRGGPLTPTRTDTELGRTAAAFDAMLDALEGAEATARASEERTRRFVADAAHELRTPIAGIAAAAEAVLHHTDQCRCRATPAAGAAAGPRVPPGRPARWRPGRPCPPGCRRRAAARPGRAPRVGRGPGRPGPGTAPDADRRGAGRGAAGGRRPCPGQPDPGQPARQRLPGHSRRRPHRGAGRPGSPTR